MILIIAGTRCPYMKKFYTNGISYYEKWHEHHVPVLDATLKTLQWVPDCVIYGEASGWDEVGKRWAERNGYSKEAGTLIGCPADWFKHGRAAGLIRNEKMAQMATHLLALWNGESPGTRDMIETADKYGLTHHVEIIKDVWYHVREY